MLLVMLSLIYTPMQNSVVGFEHLKDEYSQCSDFGIIYKESLDYSSPTQSVFLGSIILKMLSCVFLVLRLEIFF